MYSPFRLLFTLKFTERSSFIVNKKMLKQKFVIITRVSSEVGDAIAKDC